jgi:hypothetical protein
VEERKKDALERKQQKQGRAGCNPVFLSIGNDL